MAHRKTVFIGIVLACYYSVSLAAAEVERTPVKTFDEMRWLVELGPTVEHAKLHDDLEGIGKKGDKIQIRTFPEKVLGGKFLQVRWVLEKGDKTKELARDIWGIDPATNTVSCWTFLREGVMLKSKAYRQGPDLLVCELGGKIKPAGEPWATLGKQLKMEQLTYSGEFVHRRLPNNKGLGLTVQKVKVGGMPFPWPGAGEESLHYRVEK